MLCPECDKARRQQWLATKSASHVTADKRSLTEKSESKQKQTAHSSLSVATRVYRKGKPSVSSKIKDIRKAFAAKLRCWRRYKANPDNALKLKYYQCTQTCKQLITDHEKNCETRVLDTDNIGAFYKFVNRRLGNKTGISPLHDESGKLVLDDCSKANNYTTTI